MANYNKALIFCGSSFSCYSDYFSDKESSCFVCRNYNAEINTIAPLQQPVVSFFNTETGRPLYNTLLGAEKIALWPPYAS